MTDSENSKLDPNKTALIRTIIRSTGAGFIAAGVFGLVFGESVQEFLGFDALTTQIFCGALIFVGLSDFVMAHFLFKEKNKV